MSQSIQIYATAPKRLPESPEVRAFADSLASQPTWISKGGKPRKYSREFIDALAFDLIDWIADNKKEENANRLFLKRFFAEHGLYAELASRFARESAVFSHALKLAKDWQEIKLAELMANKATFSPGQIFAAKNVAGWRDRIDSDDRPEQRIKIELHLPKKQPRAIEAAYVVEGETPPKRGRGRPKKPVNIEQK